MHKLFRGETIIEWVLRSFTNKILRLVCSGLRGQSRRFDPQELCQDVFVNIYRYPGSFRDDHPRSFRVWVAAITRNVIRRHLGRRTSHSIDDLPEGSQEPQDSRSGPLDRVFLAEEHQSLSGAWGIFLQHYLLAWKELSPRDQEALRLIEVEGFTYAEACDRMSVGMSNMKMIMFRARKRIRAHMTRNMAILDCWNETSGCQAG